MNNFFEGSAPVSNFFEVGKTYRQKGSPYTAPELLHAFRCAAVVPNPMTAEPHAFGWYSVNGGWGPTGMTPGHWEQGWYGIDGSEAGW